jgi:hypothetical protein
MVNVLKELMSRSFDTRAIIVALKLSDDDLPEVLDREFLELCSKIEQNFCGCRNRRDLRKRRKQFHNFTAPGPSMWPDVLCECESTSDIESAVV